LDENQAVTVLKELHGFFNENHIRVWLDQGVLLGAIRENKLLLHDHDIDIGILHQDTFSLLHNLWKLKNQGYKVQVHANTVYLAKNGVEIGIMAYQDSGDTQYFLIDYISLGYWSIRAQTFYDMATHRDKQTVTGKVATFAYWLTYFRTARRLLEFSAYVVWRLVGGFYHGYQTPKHYYDNLKRISFYGLIWMVPAETEEYLTYKYGEDWCIPKTEWDMWNDDGGIVPEINKVFPHWKTLRADDA
jgi:hypothetical protein